MKPERLGWRLGVATALGCMLLGPSLSAQESVMSGQVRPRHEFRDPSGGGRDDFTSMRVRLGLLTTFDDGLSILVQAQDVRIWGEEGHPLFDYRADNIDLHQGYLRYRAESSPWLTTTIGRMETNFGGQRLIGAVDWAQQGQSFDGVRFNAESGRASWSFVGFTVSDETLVTVDEDEKLYGAYGTFADVGPGALDVYWFYDRLRGAANSDEQLFGARYAFSGDVSGRLEASFEAGSRADVDVSAYMLGARLGRTFSDGKFSSTLWYDYLSGDDASTPESEVFNTFFGTNHKFYGFADLFLNIPAHTAGAGLQDLALKLAWSPRPDLSVAVDVHSFRAAQQGVLSESHFGDEVDLSLRHGFSGHLLGAMGFSYVIQDQALAEIGRLSEDLSWFYLMLNATF
jgi:hypothetical protein